MGRVPPDVMARVLDTNWQNVFTYGSWAITLIMLVIAARMGLKHRTPFFVLAIVAAGVGAFGEPIYDVLYDLWFYDAHKDHTLGAMQSHFTAFGIVQPNWTHSGYVILYANAALYAGKKIYDGTFTRKHLYIVWGIEFVSSCVFEAIGTGVHVYTYYGPFQGRIVNYPFIVGVLEATQVVLFTVLAVNIWKRVKTHWGLFSLMAAFPITMAGANYGIGFPTLISLHLQNRSDLGYPDPSSIGAAHITAVSNHHTLIWCAEILTLILCALAVNGASKFLPKPAGEPETGDTEITHERITATV